MSELTDKQLLDELHERFDQNRQTLQELRQMTNKLITVNKKLEESEAMKSHFISNITNEIINPFSSILGLTKHMMQMGKEDYARMQDFARMVYEETFELDFQLKNIFAAAKLEAGEYNPQISRVKVKDLFENTLAVYDYMSNKKSIDLHLQYNNVATQQTDDLFKTDPDKLQVVLSNLVNNAIRFSPENSGVIIDLEVTDTRLSFSVQDDGGGIPPEYARKIFDRFYRIDNSINSDNKGLGLGLTVTKGILEMMGGSIALQHPEKGSIFQVELPEDQTQELVGHTSSDGNEIFFDDEHETF